MSQEPLRPGARRRAVAVGALALLLAVFALRELDTAAKTTLTADEPHYIGTGLYLWHSGDYHYADALLFQTPLAYHLASLPLLAFDLGAHEITRRIGLELMRGPEPAPQRVRFWSRVPFVLLSCWGAVLMFLWATEAVGREAGLLAAFLYTASPTLLANSALAHSDITVTVLYLQTLYLFWRWWRRPGPGRLALCGASLGLALLGKGSAVLLLPTLGLLLLARAYGLAPREGEPRAAAPRSLAPALRASGQLGALGLAAVAVLWIGYGGSFALQAPSQEQTRLPFFLPGLLFDVAVNTRGRAIYYLGEVSADGSYWTFLPLVWLLKTPIPVLVLLVMALWPRRAEPRRPGLGLFLAVPLAVYLGVALLWLRVPLGIRYLLPAIPLILLAVATRLPPLRGPRRAVAAVCAAWLLLAGVWIHPHYLAYFNEAIGGPARADRFFVESNLDWGQGLAALGEELEARGQPVVWLAYFGPEPPERYGIRQRPLRGCQPVTGTVAISATVLRGLYAPGNAFRSPPPGCYDWLLARQPVARPGHSILLYEIPPTAPRPPR